jgi:hypothetical protein
LSIITCSPRSSTTPEIWTDIGLKTKAKEAAMTKFCVVIVGPNTFPRDIVDIKMGLGMAEIPVTTLDLSKRGNPFALPEDIEAVGFVVTGNPRISIRGLREMFPTAGIVIHGWPMHGEEISDIHYAVEMAELIAIAEDECTGLEAGEEKMVTIFAPSARIKFVPSANAAA